MPGKNEEVFLQGKAKWARLVTPDVQYNRWSVQLYLDDPSYKKFLELKERQGDTDGILNTIKKDEDGYNVLLKRDVTKATRTKVLSFTPPEVFMDQDGRRVPVTVNIGNGSDITCKIEVYKYKKQTGTGYGRAIRLTSVRVDNLVEYDGKKDFTEEQIQATKGMDEVAQQPLF